MLNLSQIIFSKIFYVVNVQAHRIHVVEVRPKNINFSSKKNEKLQLQTDSRDQISTQSN